MSLHLTPLKNNFSQLITFTFWPDFGYTLSIRVFDERSLIGRTEYWIFIEC